MSPGQHQRPTIDPNKHARERARRLQAAYEQRVLEGLRGQQAELKAQYLEREKARTR
jgi:hypothetical protein